jgi:hypothetical protein
MKSASNEPEPSIAVLPFVDMSPDKDQLDHARFRPRQPARAPAVQGPAARGMNVEIT